MPGNDADAQQQKKQWRVERKNENASAQARTVQPGDSGIWVTCVRGKEAKSVGELRDLFAEYAELLYGGVDVDGPPPGDDDDDKPETSIEKDISAELAELSKPKKVQLFTPVRIDVQCRSYPPLLHSKRRQLTSEPSALLQDNPARGSRRGRQEDMPRRNGRAHAKANTICEAPLARDIDGSSIRGRPEEGGQRRARSTLPSRANSAPEGQSLRSPPIILRSCIILLAPYGAYRQCNYCIRLAA